jgi:hypothetical protein
MKWENWGANVIEQPEPKEKRRAEARLFVVADRGEALRKREIREPATNQHQLNVREFLEFFRLLDRDLDGGLRVQRGFHDFSPDEMDMCERASS